MEQYKNLSGSSGVEGFTIEETAIVVQFKTSRRLYRYSHGIAGHAHVETMKRLAKTGKGLQTYINQHVRSLYDKTTAAGR